MAAGSRTSPSETKKKIANLTKQDLIEQTWKAHNENARVPDVSDLIVWISDKIT